MAGFDAYAIGDALAAKYRSGTLTPPTGYPAVRVATADVPNNVPLSPWVLVELPNGQIIIDSSQSATLEYHVHFLYAKHSGDTARDIKAMLKWIGVLLAATFSDVTLGVGSSDHVKSALSTQFEAEVFTQGGQEWYGWDITVEVILRDLGWTVT